MSSDWENIEGATQAEEPSVSVSQSRQHYRSERARSNSRARSADRIQVSIYDDKPQREARSMVAPYQSTRQRGPRSYQDNSFSFSKSRTKPWNSVSAQSYPQQRSFMPSGKLIFGVVLVVVILAAAFFFVGGVFAK